MLLWQIEIDRDRVAIDWVGIDDHPDFAPDTCFQYYVDLDETEWFWQGNYSADTPDSVFWLSIAAIYRCPCDGDVDEDGVVGVSDLAIVLACEGTTPVGVCARADVNCDGVIDMQDAAIVQCQINAGWPDPSCCPSTAPVDPMYPWGWKTRPWHWMDDAVTFYLTEDPLPGLLLDPVNIYPIEDFYFGESWDVAFELDTDPCYIKWDQPYTGIRDWPHYEDVKSMGIVEPAGPKWQQDPNELLPGLHAHDYDLGNGPQWDTLADDWICNGGQVTDIHWWGNYEMSGGSEQRGGGIDHFHLSIHEPDPQNPCLPGPEVWGADVPFAALMEMNTGLVNSEGSAIYLYEFYLTDPYQQIEGQTYFLDITAWSNDPLDPPYWRWQESRRSPNPTLCPAVSRTGPGGVWGPIRWPGYDPVRYSDMAFVITSDDVPQLDIQSLVADDWRCDTNTPITAAAWWGSYIGYQYWACDDLTVTRPVKPDYFYLSIWSDVAADDSDNQYPYSHPGELEWEYNAYDYDEVFVGYDKHPHPPEGQLGPPREPVFRYSVGIPEGEQFCQAESDTVYWFSVVAVYDSSFSDPIYDWGWTNHKHEYNDDAVSGTLDPPNPEYYWEELYDQTGVSEDMSFILYTRPEECCPCLGDMNGDQWLSTADLTLLFNTLGNLGFPYYTQTTAGDCGDMNGDGWLSTVDLTLLFNILGNLGSPYYTQCP